MQRDSLIENQHAEGKRMKRKKGRGEEVGAKITNLVGTCHQQDS